VTTFWYEWFHLQTRFDTGKKQRGNGVMNESASSTAVKKNQQLFELLSALVNPR